MKLKFGYLLVLVASVAAFIIARKNYVSTTTEEGTTTIRVGHHTLDPQFREFLSEAGAEYERRHPNIRIKLLSVPQQVYVQWMRTQIVGEMAPEIMQFAYYNPGVEDMVIHRFAVLDSWVERPNPYRQSAEPERWRDTFRDGLNSRSAFNEKLRAYYGIPLAMGGNRFFYNETLQDEAAVRAAPWSFREFLDLRGKLNVGPEGGREIMPMGGSDYSSYVWFRMLFASVTQRLRFKLDRNFDLQISGRDAAMSFLDGEWDYHTEEIREGFELIREGSEMMRPGFTQLRKGDGVMQFIQGQSLGMGGAHVDIASLRELAAFEVGETSFPVPDENDPKYGQYVLGPVNELQDQSSLTLGVMRSPLQEQAVDFLQFLTGTEMMALLREKTHWRVSVRDEKQDTYGLKRGYPDDMYGLIISSGSGLTYYQNYYLQFQDDDSLDEFTEKMNKESPRERLEWLGQQTKALRQTLRQQEAGILAQWALSRERSAPETEDDVVAEYLRVNNRQEAEYRRLNRFLKKHAEP